MPATASGMIPSKHLSWWIYCQSRYHPSKVGRQHLDLRVDTILGIMQMFPPRLCGLMFEVVRTYKGKHLPAFMGPKIKRSADLESKNQP